MLTKEKCTIIAKSYWNAIKPDSLEETTQSMNKFLEVTHQHSAPEEKAEIDRLIQHVKKVQQLPLDEFDKAILLDFTQTKLDLNDVTFDDMTEKDYPIFFEALEKVAVGCTSELILSTCAFDTIADEDYQHLFKVLRQLPNLTSLEFNGLALLELNQGEWLEFCDTLKELNLTTLKLFDDQIQDAIPDTHYQAFNEALFCLSNLKVLHLDFNLFSRSNAHKQKLCEAINQLHNLEQLSLQSNTGLNQLTPSQWIEMGHALAKTPNFNSLCLEHNRLSELTNDQSLAICNMMSQLNLTTLVVGSNNLSGNHFLVSALLQALSQHNKLESLYVGGCNLLTLSDAITEDFCKMLNQNRSLAKMNIQSYANHPLALSDNTWQLFCDTVKTLTQLTLLLIDYDELELSSIQNQAFINAIDRNTNMEEVDTQHTDIKAIIQRNNFFQYLGPWTKAFYEIDDPTRIQSELNRWMKNILSVPTDAPNFSAIRLTAFEFLYHHHERLAGVTNHQAFIKALAMCDKGTTMHFDLIEFEDQEPFDLLLINACHAFNIDTFYMGDLDHERRQQCCEALISKTAAIELAPNEPVQPKTINRCRLMPPRSPRDESEENASASKRLKR